MSFKNGKPAYYMNKAAKEAKDLLMTELKVQKINNKCPRFENTIVVIEILPVNMRKNRDTNNLYKLLNDSIQDVGIVDNDKNIIERTLSLKYNESKESYLNLWIYEAKGKPSKEDILSYFFWCSKIENLS
jgi:Holliday junction resolvase RusA-like endonuclease